MKQQETITTNNEQDMPNEERASANSLSASVLLSFRSFQCRSDVPTQMPQMFARCVDTCTKFVVRMVLSAFCLKVVGWAVGDWGTRPLFQTSKRVCHSTTTSFQKLVVTKMGDLWSRPTCVFPRKTTKISGHAFGRRFGRLDLMEAEGAPEQGP